jgi:hypothetical protein
VGFDEDMFALLRSKDWEACHKRIEEEPALSREGRVSIGFWRAGIFEWKHRYDDALRTLDTIRTEVLTHCGFLWERAEILCKMGKFADAIEAFARCAVRRGDRYVPGSDLRSDFSLPLSFEKKRP